MVSSDFGTNVRSVPVNIPQVSLWSSLVALADERLVGNVEDKDSQARAVTFIGSIVLLGMILGTLETIFSATKQPSTLINMICSAAIGSLTTLIATSSRKPTERRTPALKVLQTPEKNKEVQ